MCDAISIAAGKNLEQIVCETKVSCFITGIVAVTCLSSTTKRLAFRSSLDFSLASPAQLFFFLGDYLDFSVVAMNHVTRSQQQAMIWLLCACIIFHVFATKIRPAEIFYYRNSSGNHEILNLQKFIRLRYVHT